MSYNPKQIEDKIYQLWLRAGFFNPDKLPGTRKKTYVIVIPPPNVTGELHMGHALNATCQDILIRKKRMEGFRTLWLPGTDHAGIATQVKVEKELKKQEGLNRHDLGREKFIEKVWEWKNKYGNIILDQLKRLGASCDWSRTRFTLDKKYVKAVENAFLHYYKKGWIYRGERVVNWCPRCRTSLSDLELEYKEEKGKLWYIKYPVKSRASKRSEAEDENKVLIAHQKFIVVATTRPETMLGDTAVAVSPKDKRYKNFVGGIVILPIQNREIPIIEDSAVDMKFGTGAVKVTPAHDLTDWEIGQRHKLESLKVIDEGGKMTKESKICEGLNPLQCRKIVIEELEKKNLIEKTEDFIHSVPYCYRCHFLIEPIPSKQWFLKMDNLAKMALKAVKSGKVKFIPKNFEKVYFDWFNPPTGGIKDWCISRQIWWGHRLPVYEKQEEIQNSKIKNQNNLEIRNSKLEIYVGNNPPNGYVQVPDVLDTWFSSALWPFATLGWPSATAKIKNQKSKIKNDLENFYPTDVLSTARDIINLWVARMIFSGMEFMGKAPFHSVFIHPTVLTKEGERMSKSLGTGIDPLNLCEKYGADATRFGIAWQLMGGQDIKFTEDNIVMGRKFCNKIWNAARFVLMQIGKSEIRNPKSETNSKFRASADRSEGEEETYLFALQIPNSKLTVADKKILKALDKTIKSVNKSLQDFQFGQAAHNLYDFFWHDFCDVYIEKTKEQNDEKTKKILFFVLLNSLKILHPFIPFITEEIYQTLPIKDKKQCLMIENWPSAR